MPRYFSSPRNFLQFPILCKLEVVALGIDFAYIERMSVVYVQTACVESGAVLPVRIEIDLQRGLPQFSIIGMPDRRIAEAKDRVRAAVKNSGLTWPSGRLTINLSPSYLQKQGTGFDLGIALGVLAVDRQIPTLPSNLTVLGELGLDGQVCPHQQLLPILTAVGQDGGGCLMPACQGDAARLALDCPVVLAKDLRQAVELICCKAEPVKPRAVLTAGLEISRPRTWKIDQILGHETAKWGLMLPWQASIMPCFPDRQGQVSPCF